MYRGWIHNPPVLGWEIDPRWELIENEFYDQFREWKAKSMVNRYGIPVRR